MPFKVTSKKNGQDYYLYAKFGPKGLPPLYSFMPVFNPDALDALPDGYGVTENAETGAPVLVKASFAAKIPATPDLAESKRLDAEKRLGVSIPRELQLIENVTIDDGDDAPFGDTCLWLNAACDLFLPIDDWHPASEDNWFENFREGEIVSHGGCVVDKYNPEHPEENLHLLIIIAHIAESHLCFDYRECGPTGMPKVTYIDTTYDPMQSETVCGSAAEFVSAVLAVPHSKLGD